MSILLTGAGGFLGSSLAREFSTRGIPVHKLRRDNGKSDTFEVSSPNFGTAYLSGKQLPQTLSKLDVRVVIHSAASYGEGPNGLTECIGGNLMYPAKVMESIIGKASPVFINTDTFFTKAHLYPENRFNYSYTKLAFNALAQNLATKHGWKYINMRLEHMYGFGENPNKFCSRVIKSCFNNDVELDLTDGLQRRDFIHVNDVVSAFVLICDRLSSGIEVEGEYSVGTGQSVSVREFVETAWRLTKSRTILNFGKIPHQVGEQKESKGDPSGLMKLGWTPGISLSEGVEDYIWRLQNRI
jgi:CDP-paratose synthetase